MQRPESTYLSLNSKKIVLISHTYIPNSNFRSSATWNILQKHFPNSKLYFAACNHLTKEKMIATSLSEIAVAVPSYKKNLSFSRVFSHLIFSLKLLFYKDIRNADIIYCSVPPNLVLLPIILLRIFNPRIKLVCDVVDLWPEAIPLPSKIKKLFDPFASVFCTLP